MSAVQWKFLYFFEADDLADLAARCVERWMLHSAPLPVGQLVQLRVECLCFNYCRYIEMYIGNQRRFENWETSLELCKPLSAQMGRDSCLCCRLSNSVERPLQNLLMRQELAEPQHG